MEGSYCMPCFYILCFSMPSCLLLPYGELDGVGRPLLAGRTVPFLLPVWAKHSDFVHPIHIHVCEYTLHRLLEEWHWQWSRTRPRSFTWEWSSVCSCHVRMWFSIGNTLSCVCTACIASPRSIFASSMTFALVAMPQCIFSACEMPELSTFCIGIPVSRSPQSALLVWTCYVSYWVVCSGSYTFS